MFETLATNWLATGIILCVTVLLYAYMAFPLLIILIGAKPRSPPERPPDTELPSVTLIIPAHNEASVIEEKIRNSLAIDYPDLEIMVVSDGSTDDTVEICQRYDSVKLVAFEKRRGKSSVLADAVRLSRGRILCLCDANVFFRPDAMWRMVSHFSRADVGGVTGDVRLQSTASSFGLAESLYYRLERSIHRGESNLGAVVGVDGGMYAIRKEYFPRLPPDTILDDFTTSMHLLRTGKKLVYEPTAVADENATELAMDEYRRRVRIGIGAAQVLRRGWFPRISQPIRMWLFVSHKLLRWASPWLLLAVFLAALGLVASRPVMNWILVPAFAFIGLALIGTFSSAARKLWVVSVPFYFGLSQVAFAWGVVRGTFFRSTGMWEPTNRKALVDEVGDVLDSGSSR